MYASLAILAAVILCNCVDFIPDSVKQKWENSKWIKWAYPAFVVILTLAVACGIRYGNLDGSVAIVPALFALPYIIGMVGGIWHNMKHAGRKVTSSDDVDAKEIAVKSLSEIGCKPMVNPDGNVEVFYQGEHFVMEFHGRYVRVWDLMWSGIDHDDPDVKTLHEAINAANYGFGPTVITGTPDKDGVIGIHSRRDIMLHPACPDNAPYMQAVLDSFFDTKERLRGKYKQISEQQQQSARPRNPIGFTCPAE